MASRTVVKVNLECNKCKRVALQCIAQINGIDMISYNKKEQTITVEGDVDPACVGKQLKKKFKCAKITSVGPPPPTKTDKKDNVENPSKKKGKKKETDKPDPPPPIMIPVPTPYITTYGPCKPVQPCCCPDCSSRWDMPQPGWHPPHPRSEVFYVYDENPNLCTIS